MDGGGISNGCGKVRGRVAGGPELSISGQIPQPGWWKARRQRHLRGSRPCLYLGPSGSACGSPRAACGLARGSARATCGPACGSARPILRPPPPSGPFGLALSRLVSLTERNETRSGVPGRRRPHGPGRSREGSRSDRDHALGEPSAGDLLLSGWYLLVRMVSIWYL